MKARIQWIVTLKTLMTFYVIIHHLSLYENNIWLYIPFGQGQFCVVVFWILSGYTTHLNYGNEISYTFLVNRAIALMPVFLMSLIVTYIFEFFHLGYFNNIDFKTLLGNILQLQDLDRHPGAFVPVYKINTPLWFVSYLTWFYIIFYVFRNQLIKPNLIVGLAIGFCSYLSYIVLPNPISHIGWYFPIWYSGYLLHSKVDLKIITYFLLVSVVTALICLNFNAFNFKHFPFLEVRHFVYAIIGVILIFLIQNIETIFTKQTKVVEYFYKISYPMFLVHYPIMVRYNPFHFNLKIINICCAFILVVGVAHVIYLIEKMILTNNKFNFNN